jgi:hypothetical protein
VTRRFGEDNELSGSARPAVVDGQVGTGRARETGPPDRLGPGPAWLPLIPSVVTLLFCLYQIQRPSFTRDETATLAAVHRSLAGVAVSAAPDSHRSSPPPSAAPTRPPR